MQWNDLYFDRKYPQRRSILSTTRSAEMTPMQSHAVSMLFESGVAPRYDQDFSGIVVDNIEEALAVSP